MKTLSKHIAIAALLFAAALHAQAPQGNPPAPAGRGGGQGVPPPSRGGGGGGGTAGPADKPLVDFAAAERGKTVWLADVMKASRAE